MGVYLMFEAGRLAERQGLQSADVVETGALGSVSPGPGQVIVVASEAGLVVSEARAVAALASSGKEVAVVTAAALSDDVLAWLPKDCLYTVGEPLGSGWAVTDGLVTLTPEAGDPSVVWDDWILEALPIKDAGRLADALRPVRVGVAWDRPIFVPSTQLSDQGILNIQGSSTQIHGVEPEEYLRFEKDLVTLMWHVGSNPLNLLSARGDFYEAHNAVLTLNISLGGRPVLLVCGPYFDGQGSHDYSACVVRERERNLPGLIESRTHSYQFHTLQARPRTNPDDLEPLPPWINSLPSDSREVVLRLFDTWASAFFRALIAWGVDWICRYGKDLDAALQADWETLIDRLEQFARE